MKRVGLTGLAIMLAALVLSPQIATAQYLQNGVTYAPDRIVIVIKPQYAPISPVTRDGIVVTGLRDIDALNRQFSVSAMTPLFPGAEKHGEPAMAGYYSLIFRNGMLLESVLEAYASLGTIEHVEPDGIHRVYFNPNDALIGYQWALNTIHARQAWDTSRGDSTVILGIADTGVNWHHYDLDGNLWFNFDDPIDGSDNDGNGYIDDIRGWDWVNNPTNPPPAPGEDGDTPDNDPDDYYGHGTHVAGIASAETNNSIGVAGLGFNCSIMALRIGWAASDGNGYVSMSYAASAFYYATNEGAMAINCSWGSDYSGGIGAAASYATGHRVVIVSAAGNDDNQIASYLCSRTDVIAVAATDQYNHKAGFSNYGSWVDVSAPGVSIYSTYLNNTYIYMDGTSMAAPYVTGLVGLIRSAEPSWTRSQVTDRIISTADNIDGINPGYAGLLGSGRINAQNALDGLGGIPLATPIPISPVGGGWLNTSHPTFIWSDTTDAPEYHLQIDQSSSYSSPDLNDSTIADTTFYCTVSLPDNSSVSSYYYWHVRGGSGSSWTDYCQSQLFRIDTGAPLPPNLLTPAQNSWTNERRPYFSWEASTDQGYSGINRYYIQVDDDSLFSGYRLIIDSSVVTHYTPSSDISVEGRIFWRVRARDNAENYGTYAVGYFNLDATPPGSPIGFNASPDGWTSDPNFTLNWTNPADPSGIDLALYKVGSPPAFDYDTTGHFTATPPASYVADSTGVLQIYLWLKDIAGNTSYLTRAQDSIRFDNIPPAGCIASSPSISGSGNFNVTWSSGNDEGSGLAGIYDVRYKDGEEGTWVDWLTETTDSSASFDGGVHNHTYYFEARTRDLVGNLEPFTAVAETQTLVDTTFTGPPFVPGDANASGSVNGLDVVFLVGYLKGGPAPPDPILRADANGSCSVNGLDVTYLVAFLKGGPAPFAGDCN